MARCGKNCNFSELKVLRNAISFPHCNEMESLWKRYWVANGSLLICDIRLPRSDRNSVTSMLMDPTVSIAIGAKWCVLLRQEYLFILFADALVAAASAIPPFRQCERQHTYPARWHPKRVAYHALMESVSLRPDAKYVEVLFGYSFEVFQDWVSVDKVTITADDFAFAGI